MRQSIRHSLWLFRRLILQENWIGLSAMSTRYVVMLKSIFYYQQVHSQQQMNCLSSIQQSMPESLVVTPSFAITSCFRFSLMRSQTSCLCSVGTVFHQRVLHWMQFDVGKNVFFQTGSVYSICHSFDLLFQVLGFLWSTFPSTRSSDWSRLWLQKNTCLPHTLLLLS